MKDAFNPILAKPEWIDRCVMTLGKLKPDISLLEAQTVASNILWWQESHLVPEQAAAEWACDLVASD